MNNSNLNRKITLLLFALSISSGIWAQDPFITTWKTDNPGASCSSCITIPTFGSGYNYDVDWNDDGTYDDTNVTGSITHDYGSPGTYTIRIRGNFPRIYFNNSGDKQKILNIDQWGDIAWSSMARAFSGCTYVNVSASDRPNLSSVTDMNNMFRDAITFNQDISDWDVSSVTIMKSMFSGAVAFNNGGMPLDWSNTGMVTDMSFMFFLTDSFNQDISDWDVSAVKSMRSMFTQSDAFNQDISDWDVSSVTNMCEMFFNADVFNNGDMPLDWANTGMVTDMSFMFFNVDSFNCNISNWDVSSVINMSGMFRSTYAFNNGGLPLDWSNTGMVTDMNYMFSNTHSFNQSISSWDVSAVVDMSAMFSSADNFNQDISSWDVSAVTDMSFMFLGTQDFDQDISDWDVSNVTDMNSMFHATFAFNNGGLPLDWANTGMVTNMNDLFFLADSFNQDISLWDVSSVIDMSDMLGGCAMDRDNYDAALISWASQSLQSGVSLGATGLKYCNGEAARNILINSFSWAISGDTKECGSGLLYVDQEATGTNDGSSWPDAYTDLQDALTQANNQDTIFIAQGTYIPSVYPDPCVGCASSQDYTFHLKDSLVIIGGYSTGGLFRDPSFYKTILSGDIGIVGDSTDNVHHVVLSVDGSDQLMIDGIQIEHGYADGSATINVASNNIYRNRGAGIYLHNSSIQIKQSELLRNWASSNGGGMCIRTSGGNYTPTVSECLFKYNHAFQGGAMRIDPSASSSLTVQIEKSKIEKNTSTSYCRGISAYNSGSNLNLFINACQFLDNNGGSLGGAINIFSISSADTDVEIVNSVFSKNSAVSGAGIHVSSNNSTSLMNVINSSFYGGAGSGRSVSSNTFGTGTSHAIISNSILWNGGNEINNANNATATIAGSIINETSIPTGVTDGGNNLLNINPLYADPVNHDLNLTPTSPALDVGINDSIPNGILSDINGDDRIYGGQVDMGAYEFNFATLSLLYVDSSATGANNGISWANAYTDLQDALDATQVGDTIWVASGTYFPARIPDSANNVLNQITARDRAFHFDRDIAVYGGFAGVETTLTQRDLSANQVILSGDIGVLGDSSDNCNHVVITANTTNAAIFDGFIIMDGGNGKDSLIINYSGQPFWRYSGAGMRNSNSAPRVSNVVFENNIASLGAGGGMYNWTNSAPILSNVVFLDNSGVYGGAMYNRDASPILNNVTFVGNDATLEGGAVRNVNSNTNITNCIFWENKKGQLSNVTGADIADNNGASVVTYSLTQENSLFSSGLGIINNQDPSFFNHMDGDGLDNAWMTSDDGLQLTVYSPAINTGTTSNPDLLTDILENLRIGKYDMGAYESPAGKDCVNPEVITTLPYEAEGWTTCGAKNDYQSNLTCVSGPFAFWPGEDLIWEITPTQDMCVDLILSGPTGVQTALLISADACFDDPSNAECIGRLTLPNGVENSIGGLHIEMGRTYYIGIAISGFNVHCGNFNLAINESTEVAQNTWTGPAIGDWYGDNKHWSQGIFPSPCQEIIIPTNHEVKLYLGEKGYGKLLDVMLSGELDVPLGAELEIE